MQIFISISARPKSVHIESVLSLRKDNLSVDEIGKRLDITPQHVGRILKEHDPNYSRKKHDESRYKEDVLKLRKEKLNVIEIGKRLGITPQHVGRILKKYDPSHTRLERKLDPNNYKADALKLKQAGNSNAEIARRLGITPTYVSRLVK